jgi:elongation factor G
MVLTIPISSFNPKHYVDGEPGIQGLVDLIRWNVWKWDDDGLVSCHPLSRNEKELEKTDIFPNSHPILPHLVPARAQLLENLSMVSEDFMEYLLRTEGSSSYLQVDDELVMRHLRSVALSNLVLPVVGGSATRHIGTELLMDFVGELFPDPLDMDHDAPRQNAPLRLLAWKVNWDERKGWMTFVRVYSGKFYFGLA